MDSRKTEVIYLLEFFTFNPLQGKPSPRINCSDVKLLLA